VQILHMHGKAFCVRAAQLYSAWSTKLTRTDHLYNASYVFSLSHMEIATNTSRHTHTQADHHKNTCKNIHTQPHAPRDPHSHKALCNGHTIPPADWSNGETRFGGQSGQDDRHFFQKRQAESFQLRLFCCAVLHLGVGPFELPVTFA